MQLTREDWTNLVELLTSALSKPRRVLLELNVNLCRLSKSILCILSRCWDVLMYAEPHFVRYMKIDQYLIIYGTFREQLAHVSFLEVLQLLLGPWKTEWVLGCQKGTTVNRNVQGRYRNFRQLRGVREGWIHVCAAGWCEERSVAVGFCFKHHLALEGFLIIQSINFRYMAFS